MKLLTGIFIFLLASHFTLAQDSLKDSTINNKRLRAFVISAGTLYSASQAGLYHLWYKESGTQSFRFFNDNAEWKQVDKVGHFYSSFYLAYATSSALRWSGLKQSKAHLAGALTGFALLLPIEVFDGFSTAYGASAGDLVANAGGAALFYGQNVLWQQIRIYPKFSFHQSQWAISRPSVLGESFSQQLLKDYNGQTYWLSFDMDKFIRFPKWLNLAVGYGAEEMVYARDSQNEAHHYDAYRQYYISIDFDLTAVKTNSKGVKTLMQILNVIKIPAPTLSFSRVGTKLHSFYF